MYYFLLYLIYNLDKYIFIHNQYEKKNDLRTLHFVCIILRIYIFLTFLLVFFKIIW